MQRLGTRSSLVAWGTALAIGACAGTANATFIYSYQGDPYNTFTTASLSSANSIRIVFEVAAELAASQTVDLVGSGLLLSFFMSDGPGGTADFGATNPGTATVTTDALQNIVSWAFQPIGTVPRMSSIAMNCPSSNCQDITQLSLTSPFGLGRVPYTEANVDGWSVFSTHPTPEPGTLALLVLGLARLAILRRNRARNASPSKR